MDRTILIDVDGVILNWNHSFDYWMKRKGYTKVRDDSYEIDARYGIEDQQEVSQLVSTFCESASIGWLSPYLDAQKYVIKLHQEHGFVFHCITAISDDIYVKKLRQINLENIFGKTAIERLVCVSSSEKKYPILKEYEQSNLMWIEDKWQNVLMGHQLGLQGVLVNHPYNVNANLPVDVKRACNWKQIYELVLNHY